jgi:competence protein ComGC
MVLIVMLAILSVLLFLFAPNIVLSLMQQKQAKRNPTGLQTNTEGAES